MHRMSALFRDYTLKSSLIVNMVPPRTGGNSSNASDTFKGKMRAVLSRLGFVEWVSLTNLLVQYLIRGHKLVRAPPTMWKKGFEFAIIISILNGIILSLSPACAFSKPPSFRRKMLRDNVRCPTTASQHDPPGELSCLPAYNGRRKRVNELLKWTIIRWAVASGASVRR